MPKRSRRKTPKFGPGLLLQRLCPLRELRNFKSYVIRAKTRELLYEGKWHSISALRELIDPPQFGKPERKKTHRKTDSDRRTPEALERRRIQKREYHRKNRDRINAKARVRRSNWTKEQRRADSKRNWEARKRRPEYRKVWNDWYARNRERYCLTEIARRDRRDLSRQIRRSSEEFRAGKISYDEFDRRLREALARLHENPDQKQTPGSAPGLQGSPRDSQSGEANRSTGKGEAGRDPRSQ